MSDTGVTTEGGGGASPRDQGASLMRLGRFSEAASALRRAVEADPDDEASWRLLGGALASSGDPAGAVQAFDRAVSLVPQSAKNHYNLAVALQAAGEVLAARNHLEQALALEPGYDQARATLDALANQSTARGYGAPLPPPEETEGSVGARSEAARRPSAGPPVEELAPVGGAFAAPVRPAAPAVSAPPTGGGRAGGGGDDLAPVGGAAAGLAGGDLSPAPYGAPPPAAAPAATTAGPVGAPAVASAPVAAPGGPIPPGSYPAPGSYAPPPVLGMNYGLGDNTSGMKTTVPVELQGGWNWGAFFFSWIWLIAHKMVGLGVGLFVGSLVLGFIPIVNVLSGVAGLGISIYLGTNGNRIGWQNRRFESVVDFRACQAIWAKWVLWIFVVFVALPILAAILFPVLMQARRAGGGG